MLLGFFLFAACDIQAKVLTETLNPFQVVWLRNIGLCLGVLVMLALRGTHLLRTTNPVLQVMRGLVAAVSAACFIFALRYVPLADAVAVSFVAPFMVTVLGALLLREPVGPRRWGAVAVGFLGMLIVIRPGYGVFHPAILLVVLAAMAFSARQILSRWLSGGDGVATTVAYTSLTATAAASLVQPFVWTTPTDPGVWALIVGLAVTAGLGEVFVIRALDVAQAVVLAPLQYTMILWGTFYGYMVYSDLPDAWTLGGCAVIVASGLYTLHRERQVARRAAG
ncbi:transporter [Pseudoponticoccus marisrubri]|uniref:Transporter n=2 Tax=Pseudoponticoccus marisrubri TaxID=1685382 RepID=A0A0W7WQM3_9RHOB|nr:transporter [Pseudoponticoccus marisrubri]